MALVGVELETEPDALTTRPPQSKLLYRKTLFFYRSISLSICIIDNGASMCRIRSPREPRPPPCVRIFF